MHSPTRAVSPQATHKQSLAFATHSQLHKQLKRCFSKPFSGSVMHLTSYRLTLGAAVLLGVASGAALAAGDLSRQAPIELTVDLGSPGKHEFSPRQLRFETGKLYKLTLRNSSSDPHYFTSHAFSQMVFTRKVQVTQIQDGKPVTLAEFKGAIREVEVYPEQSAEWWLVPIAAGRASDLRCEIRTSDGKSHAELGMTGEIVIE
jgi:uncharacterized cupredoxin-like copper-binding protein